MCTAVKNPADRSFVRRCRVCVGVFLVFYLAFLELARHAPSAPFRLVLGGLAGAAFFAEIVSAGQLLLRVRDEFQRALLTRSFQWACIITLGWATIWGFVEIQSHGATPHIPVLALPFSVICFTAAVKLIIFRKFRPPVE